MNISPKLKQQLKLQNSLFYILLFIATILLSQIALKTNHQADSTANNRNTLSNTTLTLLQQLDQEITIQVFISPTDQHSDALKLLLSRYQHETEQLKIDYINPDFSPSLVRDYKIQQQGEMVVSMAKKQTHVYDLSEQSLTNALINVSRNKEQKLVFITGHGERNPLNNANFDLSLWHKHLEQKGIQSHLLNLVTHSYIPENTAAIVIASPETAWLEGEIAIIQDYITNGGNLLWLAEPQSHHHLNALSEQLNIEFVNGVVMDPNSAQLGIDDPQFVLINNYANHPIGIATTGVTLFPQSVGLMPTDQAKNNGRYIPLLTSQNNTWSETNASDEVAFDLGEDTQGPLNLGYLITRQSNLDQDPEQNSDQATSQRLAIIGDGDFLSNSYIGNASNLELGMALANWLVEDDALIAIPVKTTLDNSLTLTAMQSAFISIFFLIVLPLSLLIMGFTVWKIRRNR